MLFFVLLSILVVILFFVGAGALVSLTVAQSSLISMHEDIGEWNRLFGKDASLESMQMLSSGYFTIVAFVSMMSAAVLTFVLVKGVRIA